MLPHANGKVFHKSTRGEVLEHSTKATGAKDGETMSETSTMRPKVLKNLKSLDGIPVENSAKPGTQDVNFVEGWIELKWLRSWPKRADSIVRIPHFTQTQKLRQKFRRAAGGRSWLLLQVRREWLLFDGVVAADNVGKKTRRQLIDLAEVYWHKGFPPTKEFQECILQRQKKYSFTDGVKD